MDIWLVFLKLRHRLLSLFATNLLFIGWGVFTKCLEIILEFFKSSFHKETDEKPDCFIANAGNTLFSLICFNSCWTLPGRPGPRETKAAAMPSQDGARVWGGRGTMADKPPWAQPLPEHKTGKLPELLQDLWSSSASRWESVALPGSCGPSVWGPSGAIALSVRGRCCRPLPSAAPRGLHRCRCGRSWALGPRGEEPLSAGTQSAPTARAPSCPQALWNAPGSPAARRAAAAIWSTPGASLGQGEAREARAPRCHTLPPPGKGGRAQRGALESINVHCITCGSGKMCSPWYF